MNRNGEARKMRGIMGALICCAVGRGIDRIAVKLPRGGVMDVGEYFEGRRYREPRAQSTTPSLT